MVTLSQVAKVVGLELPVLRDIFSEKPDVSHPKDLLDKVYATAREMGYDFKKLRIGKRMNVRKEVLAELTQQIEAHPGWKRKEILAFLTSARDMVDRVQRRSFAE
ncbi:MAG: hypothetical protein RDV41_15380, partial [Planctomycetota bacterium]|nr:hypothetical protein [Planctomycetota bacterium]